jgi:hypothetical protein
MAHDEDEVNVFRERKKWRYSVGGLYKYGRDVKVRVFERGIMAQTKAGDN